MDYSLGDGLTVMALTGGVVAYWYFKHAERQRRLDIVHAERLAAMEKGIPLPELPLDPPAMPKLPDPHAPLLHGIVWAALGGGAALGLFCIGPFQGHALWPLPLPLAFLGLGLLLYYAVVSDRRE